LPPNRAKLGVPPKRNEKLEIVQSERVASAGGRGVWGEFRLFRPASSVRTFSDRHRIDISLPQALPFRAGLADKRQENSLDGEILYRCGIRKAWRPEEQGGHAKTDRAVYAVKGC